jgi:hypothetical protein
MQSQRRRNLWATVTCDLAKNLDELEFDLVLVAARHRRSAWSRIVAKVNMVHALAWFVDDLNTMAVQISKRLNHCARRAGRPDVGFVRRLTRRSLPRSRSSLLLTAEPVNSLYSVGKLFDPHNGLALILVKLKEKMCEQRTPGKHRRLENLAA